MTLPLYSDIMPECGVDTTLTGDGFVLGPILMQHLAVALDLSGSQLEFLLELLRKSIERPVAFKAFMVSLREPTVRPALASQKELRDLADRGLVSLEATTPWAMIAPLLKHLASAANGLYGAAKFRRRPPPALVSDPDTEATKLGCPELVIVTGFLGSGKTTLVNTLLRLPEMTRTLVFINEIGEAPADHLAMQPIMGLQDVFVLANGCLCCSFGDEIIERMRRAVKQRDQEEIPWFDRIVLETSGAADPIALMERIQTDRELRTLLRWRGTCVTVDAQAYGDFCAPEAERQLAAATWVVATKRDLVETEMLPATLDAIRAAAPWAKLLSARSASEAGKALLAELLLPLGEPSDSSSSENRPNAQPPTLTSTPYHSGLSVVTLRRDDVRSLGLRLFCDMLMLAKGDDLFRMKGDIELVETGEHVLLQAVRSSMHELTLLESAPPGSRLTIIGRDLSSAGVGRLFDAAQAITLHE